MKKRKKQTESSHQNFFEPILSLFQFSKGRIYSRKNNREKKFFKNQSGLIINFLFALLYDTELNYSHRQSVGYKERILVHFVKSIIGMLYL